MLNESFEERERDQQCASYLVRDLKKNKKKYLKLA